MKRPRENGSSETEVLGRACELRYGRLWDLWSSARPSAEERLARNNRVCRSFLYAFSAAGAEQIKIPARARLRFTLAKALKESVLGVTGDKEETNF
jgi:hypothetical protein